MISLYESILGDIDINIAASDNAAAMLNINKPGSDLRKVLGVDDFHLDCEDPFDINGQTLEMFPSSCKLKWSNRYTTYAQWSTDRLKDSISNMIGVKINKIHMPGTVFISGDNVDKFSNLYAPELDAGIIKFNTIRSGIVQDVKLRVSTHKMSRIIPNIQFISEKPATLKNVDLTIDAEHSYCRIIFTRLPVFRNVKGNVDSFTVEIPNDVSQHIKAADIFNDSRFNDLFEFGYKIKYINRRTGEESRNITVKDVKSFKSMISAKDFHDRDYSEWPYRLKPNIKLADIIDVSSWTCLNRFFVKGDKFCIAFYKKEYFDFNFKHHSQFASTLKQQPTNYMSIKDVDIIKNSIPVTADGWYVVVCI